MPEQHHDNRQLLIRLDERMKAMVEDLAELKEDINDIKSNLKAEYVTKREHAPIQRAVYSAIGIILTAVLGTVLFKILGIVVSGH
jgi:hypothetical protein